MKNKYLEAVGYFIAGFLALELMNHFYMKSLTSNQIIILSATFTTINLLFNFRKK